jgi:hypothetical protein
MAEFRERSISPIPGSMDMSSGMECLTFRGPKASLQLADGSSVQGYSFGAEVNVAGEVVFK